jgi:nucleoid-associated protein YgaU
LIIGFSVFLVVGVLVGDYFSKARMAKVDPGLAQGGFNVPAEPVPAPADPMDRPLAEGGRTIHMQPAVPPVKPTIIETGMAPTPPGADEIVMGGKRALVGDETLTNDGGSTLPATPSGLPDEVYTVKAGDSLYKIASRLLGDAKLSARLADYNRATLKGGDFLREGMKLNIPRGGEWGLREPAAKPALKPKPATSREIARESSPLPRTSPLPRDAAPEGTSAKIIKTATRTYTVKEKDTLGHIAASTLGSAGRWREIADLNDVSPSDLKVGMVLKLPAK